jgi:hypothetical protein
MFEASVEKYWFGATSAVLAKRAAPTPAPKISPLLAEAAGCTEEEIVTLHSRNEFDKNFFCTPDPLDALLEKVRLDHALGITRTPASDPMRQENLSKLFDVADLTKRPGHVSLTPADGGPLAKMASGDDLRKLAAQGYMQRRLDENREFISAAEAVELEKCIAACDMTGFLRLYEAIGEAA